MSKEIRNSLFGLPSSGGKSWSRYWAQRSLFFLDGTISGDTFVDKSGNARHFTITGKDFDTSWTKGFPYKSAATISAPVGDATLIAADINNFLYDSGGTPNAIPVVSLFQDIDYEHKIFCKHEAQVVDGNGVETYEPRVSNIYMATDVLSGADLVKAQSYFGVPVESGTAYWVSKAGNDGTGDGTKAKPYLTIEKAYKTVDSGSTIYVKSGVYTEEYNGTTIRYFYADRAGTWAIKGLGIVSMITVSTDYILRIVAGTTNWHRIVFNGTTDTTTLIGHFTGSSNYCNLYDCKLYNAATNNINIGASANTNEINLYRCVLPQAKVAIIRDYGIISGCLMNTACIFYAKGEYSYNKHTDDTYATPFAVVNGASIVFNNKVITKNGFLEYTVGGDVNVRYNDITLVYTADVGSNLSVLSFSNISCTPTISNNRIVCNDAAVARAVFFILIATDKVTLPVIENNYMYSASLTNVLHVLIQMGDAVVGKVKLNNNYFHCNTLDGIAVAIGGETLKDAKCNESEVKSNVFIGHLLDNPTEVVGTIHFALLNCGIDYDIRYNYVAYTGLGVVLKTGATAQAYTKNGIGYNVFFNNRIDIWVRGVQNLAIYNNSHYVDAAGLTGLTPNARIQVDENTAAAGDQFSEDVTISNSILMHNVNFDSYLAYFDAHAAANGCLINNCIFDNINAGNKLLLAGATVYTTTAALDAAGYGSGNIEANPLYVNGALGLLTLQAGSPAIGAGADLGAAYDDGLDDSTDWGDINTLPTVVTKQQGAAWDIGAYVS